MVVAAGLYDESADERTVDRYGLSLKNVPEGSEGGDNLSNVDGGSAVGSSKSASGGDEGSSSKGDLHLD